MNLSSLMNLKEWIPFVSMITDKENGGKHISVRLLEAVIIGAIVAFTSLEVQKEQIGTLKSMVEKQDQQIKELRQEILTINTALTRIFIDHITQHND